MRVLCPSNGNVNGFKNTDTYSFPGIGLKGLRNTEPVKNFYTAKLNSPIFRTPITYKPSESCNFSSRHSACETALP